MNIQELAQRWHLRHYATPLPGWDWVDQHQNDPYEAGTAELILAGVKYQINARNPNTLNEVMRVNR